MLCSFSSFAQNIVSYISFRFGLMSIHFLVCLCHGNFFFFFQSPKNNFLYILFKIGSQNILGIGMHCSWKLKLSRFLFRNQLLFCWIFLNIWHFSFSVAAFSVLTRYAIGFFFSGRVYFVFSVLLVSVCAFLHCAKVHFYDFFDSLDYDTDIEFTSIFYARNLKAWYFSWSLIFEGFAWHFPFLVWSFLVFKMCVSCLFGLHPLLYLQTLIICPLVDSFSK